MCGFVGVFSASPRSPVTDDVLTRMLATIAPRGPDGTAFFRGDHLALGFARLAVVDAAGGGQPMATDDGRVRVVFNGEIYNHADLRAQLAGKGQVFRTRSDTETLLGAYSEWGDDCLSRLRGIFAFAIWDTRRRALFLARDRSGIKPLYVQRAPGIVRFASEAKAILADPAVPRALDVVGCFAPPQPDELCERTAFDGITQLGAGCALWISPPQPERTWRYWSYAPAPAGECGTDAQVIASFRDELDRVVKMQMMSDAPIGAYLSGGVDSAAIVATMAAHAAEPLRTYTSAIQVVTSDDAWFASTLAQQLGLRARFIRAALDEPALALLPLIAWAAEGDFDAGFICRFQLAWAARQDGLKVLVSGQGIDEILTGYHRSFAAFAAFAARRAAHRVLFDGRRPDFAGVLSTGDTGNADVAATAELKRQHAALSGYLLRFEDRMGMLAGVEVRVPYLDHQLLELCARVPPARRADLFSNKHLLREAVAGRVPDLCRLRPKFPFNASLPPLTQLLDQHPGAGGGLGDLLSPAAVKQRGYFAPADVQRLVDARRFDALDGVLVIHLLDEVFVRNFDPLRFSPVPPPPIDDVAAVDHGRLPAERLMLAARRRLTAQLAPAVDPLIVRVGLLFPVNAAPAASAAPALVVHFSDGREPYTLGAAVWGDAGADSRLVELVRLADGRQTYAALAVALGLSTEDLFKLAEPLHAHRIFSPTF